MGKFIAPEWQKYYRYISLGDNLLAVSQKRPIPILLTYDPYNQAVRGRSNFHVLGRFAFCLVRESGKEWFHDMSDRSHCYHPWGIENSAVCNGNDLAVSLVSCPLIEENGFLLEVKIENLDNHSHLTRIMTVYGGIASVKQPRMIPEFSEAEDDEVILQNNTAILRDKALKEPSIFSFFSTNRKVAYKTIDSRKTFARGIDGNHGPLVHGEVDLGSIRPHSEKTVFFIVTFDKDCSSGMKNVQMIRNKASEYQQRTIGYFASVLDTAKVVSPSRYINQGFEAGLLDLEYTWYKNLGWIEIVSAWCDLWPQIHIPGVCALRQLERAKSCLLAHAKTMREDGKVMSLDTGGRPRAGNEWEHSYINGASHYYNATNDRDFIEQLWPYLVKMYDYRFSIEDKDDNLLISWQAHMEHQEDQIRIYHCGASATIAGIWMSRMMAGFAHILGRKKEKEWYQRRAGQAKKRLFNKLWDSKLGRFIYWIDESGVRHIESQYHTYAWPVIFGITDLLDSYTSLKHLKETLISARDIVYNSNQFPEDRLSCLGAQESILVSGVAAVALSKIGDTETCYRILEGCSKCIMDPPQEGQVPEQAQIDYQSYFSSAAANYLRGVIEGLFGISPDFPKNKIFIQPCLPPHWDKSGINLGDIKLSIRQSKSAIEIKLRTETKLKHVFRIKIPVGRIRRCTLDEKKVKFTLEPGINCFFLVTESPPSIKSDLKIMFTKQSVKLKYDKEISLGQTFCIDYAGFDIAQITDREGLTKRKTIQEDRVELHLKEKIPIGSHTLFLEARVNRSMFYIPIDVFIHEKIEIETNADVIGEAPDYKVPLKITNWQPEVLKGSFQVDFLGRKGERQVSMKKGKPVTWNIDLDKKGLYLATPGKNELNIKINHKKRFRKDIMIRRPFVENKALRARAKSRLIHLDLGKYYSHNFEEFLQLRQSIGDVYRPDKAFLSEIKNRQKQIQDKGTGIAFHINGRRLCPVYQANSLKIPIGRQAQKIYLLTVSYLTVEDAYSKVGEIEWRYSSNSEERMDLHLPGNINWGYYYRGYETSLSWSRGLSIVLPNTVLDVIEILPGKREPILDLTISTHGLRPVIGLLGAALINDCL